MHGGCQFHVLSNYQRHDAYITKIRHWNKVLRTPNKRFLSSMHSSVLLAFPSFVYNIFPIILSYSEQSLLCYFVFFFFLHCPPIGFFSGMSMRIADLPYFLVLDLWTVAVALSREFTSADKYFLVGVQSFDKTQLSQP